MSEDLNSTCYSLLKSIRDSGLNFVCQETPWSFSLILRKYFIKPRNIKTVVTSEQTENLSTENELNILKVEWGKLAEIINSLKKLETVKSDLDDVIEECYAKNIYNDKLSRVNTNLVEKIKGFVAEYYTLTVDKTKFEV